MHTVQVVAGGPSHAWTDRSIEVDGATSFRLSGANGHRRRYGLLDVDVLASDQETLLVSDGYEMALFVAAGAGARYAQSDHEHSEQMRSLR